MAFAGATFHASPAPSALPIPSFLSKSSSETPVSKATVEDSSLRSSDGHVTTPFRPASLPHTIESPLDFMFRAHREEQRRTRGGGLTESTAGPKSPQTMPQLKSIGPSVLSSLPNPRRSYLREPFGGIDASELDGTPGRAMGPAFSTPYQERIKAARSTSHLNISQTRSQDSSVLEKSHPDDPTEALKKFLFGNVESVSSKPARATPENSSIPPRRTTAEGAVSSANESRAAEPRMNEIEAMENDLRRILKLDIGTNSNLTGQTSISR
ncbi:uncharacterized protein UV8b_06324 [Ustilaginoidea virens]|uniref:Uncharacterized protein n=1 Tax=Ustilaginoidea virens TaxID=1159556 RepID=A0A063BLZ3_USTVR|nr:uncharacterized protein UV8b_06324 [Ustilaginoidea virens]QUC22083.1 hypothetical protein UV8b_06324 [Ustilaginoidea virens]GAO19623.1 hypothetical protein UVI_02022520 [Ustilaginoidea virens]